MFLYPYVNLFLSSLFLSTLMAVSSSHWLMIWMSLEINMISFLPLIASSNWSQETEGALKYLLFQALGSSFILMGSLHHFLSIMPMVGLCTKLGLSPMHYWFPSVMKSINWFAGFILMTWQKLAPMIILISFFSSFKTMFCLVGVLSAMVGGLGGLNQSHLRPLLAYSSIGHMGWMMTTAAFSPSISFFYLVAYIFISISLISNAFYANISSIFQSSKPNYIMYFCLVLPCMLSLSGLPPFMGFFPKMFSLFAISEYVIPLFLLLGSILNLSYYLNFFFSLFFSSPKSMLAFPNIFFSMFNMSLTFFAVSPVPFIFLYFLFT